MKINRKLALFWGVVAATGLLTFAPSIAQNQDYHVFADQRTVFGIPNFWNVASNLPFALIGLLGLWKVRNATARTLFGGVFLTCFGSAYYHLAPDDARLVWDRLPMTLIFMSLVATILGKNPRGDCSGRLALPLIICGAASVLWWRATGNLAPYVLVQFGSMLILFLAVLFVENVRGLWPVLALYVLAKLAEYYDRPLYFVLSLSGHTWKHLLSGLAIFFILLRFQPRQITTAHDKIRHPGTIRPRDNLAGPAALAFEDEGCKEDVMNCPNCGLINPPTAESCDCSVTVPTSPRTAG